MGRILFLDHFLDEIPDPQKDHGADDGAEDLPVPLAPEGSSGADETQQLAADQAAEKADDDVPDEAALVLDDEEAGQPACDGSEEQSKDNVHGFSV
jgi:hypothetical protein